MNYIPLGLISSRYKSMKTLSLSLISRYHPSYRLDIEGQTISII
jgi:hypothetical protein